MKRAFVFSLVFLITTVLSFGQDKEQIEQIIQKSYVNGLHNGGPAADIRQGFHASFNMLRLMDNKISPLPIEEWISNRDKNLAKATSKPFPVTAKYIFIDVTGNNAVAKLELFREEKKIFTDYLVLYKFTEGWRIVSKTFFRH